MAEARLGSVSISTDGVLTSKTCAVCGPTCECQVFVRSQKLFLEMIRDNAQSDLTGSSHNFGLRTYSQLAGLLRTRDTSHDGLRIQILRHNARLAVDMRRELEWKQVLVEIGRRDVPRLRHIISAMLERGARPGTVLARLRDAASGRYKPRGDWNETDEDMADLLCFTGHARATMAAHVVYGLPSARTLRRRHRADLPFRVTTERATLLRDVKHNISAVLPCMTINLPRVMTIDETRLRPGVMWDMFIRGLCWQHIGSAEGASMAQGAVVAETLI